jgi:hypothetical protein
MRQEFVMRGQTEPGVSEVLNFGKYKQGYGYRITEFQLYPSTNIGNQHYEMTGSITAGKTALDPDNPDFNNESLIATGLIGDNASEAYPHSETYVINDTYVITQNLILLVKNTVANPINWQCRFESVKMTGAEEAAVNYKQFMISDGS